MSLTLNVKILTIPAETAAVLAISMAALVPALLFPPIFLLINSLYVYDSCLFLFMSLKEKKALQEKTIKKVFFMMTK